MIKLKPLLSLLLGTIFIFVMLVMIGKVLIPFIIALILAYVLDPLVAKLESKFKLKRNLSALLLSVLILLNF